MKCRQNNTFSTSPDSSENIFEQRLFFMVSAERPKEAPSITNKKRILKKILKRIAGMAS